MPVRINWKEKKGKRTYRKKIVVLNWDFVPKWESWIEEKGGFDIEKQTVHIEDLTT